MFLIPNSAKLLRPKLKELDKKERANGLSSSIKLYK